MLNKNKHNNIYQFRKTLKYLGISFQMKYERQRKSRKVAKIHLHGCLGFCGKWC